MNQAVLEQKKQLVSDIKGKFEKAQSIVLVDYRGLTVEKVTELRNKYREAGVEYKVYKNTLMRFAFDELGLQDFGVNLEGPNAVAICYDDAVTAARITHEFAKDNDKLKIKAGVVEGQIMDAASMEALATIPSREALIAQLAGVLQANIRNLAYMLDQVSKQNETATEAVETINE